MKLSEQEIQQVERQTDSKVISQDHPSVPELESHFGEHTFFVDDDGLHVWERPSDDGAESGKLVGVRLATWSDDKKNTLVRHEPAPTQVIHKAN